MRAEHFSTVAQKTEKPRGDLGQAAGPFCVSVSTSVKWGWFLRVPPCKACCEGPAGGGWHSELLPTPLSPPPPSSSLTTDPLGPRVSCFSPPQPQGYTPVLPMANNWKLLPLTNNSTSALSLPSRPSLTATCCPSPWEPRPPHSRSTVNESDR